MIRIIKREGRGAGVSHLWSAILAVVVGFLTASYGEAQTLYSLGVDSLIGGDATDPNDDGDANAGANSLTWAWQAITTSPGEDAAFGSSGAFRVFDNVASGRTAQWCCGDVTNAVPRSVTVEFAQALALTHFTITSGDTASSGDPQDWQISGSNDGTSFTPIFTRSDDTPIWTKRNETILVSLSAASPAYKFIRYEATRTAGTFHHIAEIEYFGFRPGEDTDGDLMRDSWETANGLDPTVNDGGLDPDLDGRTNLTEFQRGTDPVVNPTPFLKAGQWKIRTVEALSPPRQLESGFNRVGVLDMLKGHFSQNPMRHARKRINFKERLFDENWIFPESVEPFPQIGEYTDREDFVVEVTGDVYMRTAGSVVIGFNSDEGGGLWIDGTRVIIYNQNRSRGTSFVVVDLAAGVHAVRMVMWENRGSSGLALFAGSSTGSLTLTEISPETVELLEPFDIAAVATADTDRDGMDDFQEMFYFGSINADPDGDPDGDGLANAAELSGRSNPTVADTDGDGADDRLEIEEMLTDPADFDQDQDGAADGLEHMLGSNPTIPDTDEDGFSDGQEAQAGTDPANPDLFPGSFTGVPLPVWSYSQDFTNQDGVVNLPDGSRVENLAGNSGKIAAGNLELAANSAPSQVDFRLPTLGTAAVGGFRSTFRFKMQADAWAEGFTFSLKPSASSPGIAFLFDANPLDTTAPGYRIAIDGTVLAGGTVDTPFPADGDWHAAELSWSPVRGASIFIDGEPLLENVSTGGFTPCAVDQFVFSANHAVTAASLQIDDIAIVSPYDRGDSDGDGLLDAWEMAYFGNLESAATDNADGDGWDNAEEQNKGTSPVAADTDQDGLSDHFETGTGLLVSATDTGTDPLLPDTDGDGMADGREFRTIAGSTPTNPNAYDTDGDGDSDAREIELGHSPVDPNDAPNSFATPFYSHFDRSWHWRLENLRFSWDRNSATLLPNEKGVDLVWEVSAVNVAESNLRDAWLGLRYVRGDYSLFAANDANILTGSGNNSFSLDQRFSPADLNRQLGLSGYGSQDSSDRLIIDLKWSPCGGPSEWAGALKVWNQDRNELVMSRTSRNWIASASILDGSGVWISRHSEPEAASLTQRLGVALVKSLESIGEPDRDNDGMSDTFETTFGFNPDLATDAQLDRDADGILNITEALIGSNPAESDSDNDGWNDLYELQRGYDPTDAASAPLFSNFALPPIPTDLNGNGLDDLWESSVGTFSLSGAGDEDGDSISNADELAQGTDPFDPASGAFTQFPVGIQLLEQPDGPALLWNAVPGASYAVMTSQNLRDWAAFTTLSVDTAGPLSFTLADAATDGQAALYFSVEVTAGAGGNGDGPTDTDADGISDEFEALLGTDPLSANSVRQQETGANTILSGDYLSFLDRMGNGSGTTEHPSNLGALTTPTQAARLLEQATFGTTTDEIERVRTLGIAGWIDDQITNQPTTLHEPVIAALWQDFLFGLREEPFYNKSIFGLEGNNATIPFMRAATQASDQLRQRVAFAMSQIFVISRQDNRLTRVPQGTCNFYDILVRNAFGSYEDMLLEIALHPVMGLYLSHVGNQKADPAVNQFPDENFAREVMQLFSIGLWELNPDGSRILDEAGEPIPSYSNESITELARVMTGLWYADRPWGDGGDHDFHFLKPMELHYERHDFGTKTLFPDRNLPGRPLVSIPAREPSTASALLDIRDAVKALVQHPNTPPFISRQLIQFLITANPSPQYIERVQNVFVDNGNGARGDLAAVIRAILLDDEARSPVFSIADVKYGKLKEPVLRLTAAARAFNLGRHEKLGWYLTDEFGDAGRQVPTFSFSVFNFYRPDYQAPGPLRDANLVGPTFQITDAHSSVALPNYFWNFLNQGLQTDIARSDQEYLPLDYSEVLPLAGNAEALADHFNLIFCSGRMSARTRSAIMAAVNQIPPTDPELRTVMAAYLTLMCPEASVQR
ncbi:MAG: DUF1800 family protein [Verrucomicrobiales bacterium]